MVDKLGSNKRGVPRFVDHGCRGTKLCNVVRGSIVHVARHRDRVLLCGLILGAPHLPDPGLVRAAVKNSLIISVLIGEGDSVVRRLPPRAGSGRG
jgi:hypothetical protein